jgi:hypothetical protein
MVTTITRPDNQEEITMFAYPIYRGLAKEHIRDLHAVATRHNLSADARRHRRTAAAGQPQRRSPRQNVVARLLALVHVRASRGTTSATTSATASPMGCLA